MIDLHCHILPGIDDGAPDLEASAEMARAAVRQGTRVMVATPHVSSRYRNERVDLARLVGELNIELAQRAIPLAVVAGAEVAHDRLASLEDDLLGRLCLGDGPYLLVETPYARRADDLEEALFGAQLRGLRPVLAHPERCPAFHRDPDRLRSITSRGILCSITAGSLTGQFGSRARRLAIRMLRDGLVHSIASDAHDHSRRGPDLSAGMRDAERDLPGVADRLQWFANTVPSALLAGEQVPAAPPAPGAPPSAFRRLLSRFRGRRPASEAPKG